MQIIGNTDRGCVRKSNQDYFTNRVLAPGLGFSIVCDGMGGIGGGEIASRTAVEYIENVLCESDLSAMDGKEIKNLLTFAVVGANDLVYNQAKQDLNLKGMGTTVVVTVIKDNKIYGISDGDSRLYKINLHSKEMMQITHDHTVVQFLLERGEITAEQAANHPQKHYITRAIGVDEYIEVDSFELDFQEMEAILICTDGLYNYMSAEDLAKKSLDSIQIGTVQPLIDHAKANGGGDNITAVLVIQCVAGGSY